MKKKICKKLIAVPALLLIATALAEEQTASMLPARVQVILDKADKKTEAVAKDFWKMVLAIDRVRLKELNEAMVDAAKARKSDEIPVIQRLIEEAKEKVKADEDGTGAMNYQFEHVICGKSFTAQGGGKETDFFKTDGTWVDKGRPNRNGKYHILGRLLIRCDKNNKPLDDGVVLIDHEKGCLVEYHRAYEWIPAK